MSPPAFAAAPRSAEERRAVAEAAAWFVRLQGQAGDAAVERRQWQQWRDADPAHAWAWQRVEQVCRQFRQVPGRVAAPAFASLASRRQVLGSLVLLLSAGAVGLGAYRLAVPELAGERYRTARGERRELRLADGSSVTLNGGSDLRVVFDGTRRRLHLQAGEILVATHPDSHTPARPFSVGTPQGEVRALGTRFSIRLAPDHALVGVQEKAVELSPVQGPAQRLEAGQQSRLYAAAAARPEPAEAHLASWQQGYLVAVDMPLGRFLEELGRYHPGYLGCDDGVAGLRVFGAFPTDDLEESLDALLEVHPLRRRRLSRFWNRLEAVPAAQSGHS